MERSGQARLRRAPQGLTLTVSRGIHWFMPHQQEHKTVCPHHTLADEKWTFPTLGLCSLGSLSDPSLEDLEGRPTPCRIWVASQSLPRPPRAPELRPSPSCCLQQFFFCRWRKGAFSVVVWVLFFLGGGGGGVVFRKRSLAVLMLRIHIPGAAPESAPSAQPVPGPVPDLGGVFGCAVVLAALHIYKDFYCEPLFPSTRPKTVVAEVDPLSLSSLLSHGFEEGPARRALRQTGNDTQAGQLWLGDGCLCFKKFEHLFGSPGMKQQGSQVLRILLISCDPPNVLLYCFRIAYQC